METGKLFIVSAPSGAGKTSLTNAVVHALAADYPISKIITYTTRTPRAGETQGVDYHFVSLHEFNQKKTAGDFLETTEYNGNFYGSPRSILHDLENGKSFIVVLDRPGAQHMKNLVDNPVLLWLTVPNLQTLQERILHRGTESEAVLKQRLTLAQHEIHDEECDPTFTYHVVNTNFEQATQDIIKIITKELN